MQFCMAAYTDRGKTRAVNQDALLLQQAAFGWEPFVLAAVCDGMGGLQKGELASSEVLRSLSEWFCEELPEILRSGERERKLLYSWENLVHKENEKLYRYGEKEGIRLGTTLTAALFTSEAYYAVHVGDSRLYEIGTEAVQLTRDHSLAAEAVEQGLLRPEEGAQDRRRSVLTRCIGAAERAEPEYRRGLLKRDAVYLLCSDGFWHGNGSDRLAEAFSAGGMTGEKALRKAAKKLAAENRKKGETDNISALLVRPSGAGKEENHAGNRFSHRRKL